VIADASFNVGRQERGMGHMISSIFNAIVPNTQKPSVYYAFNDVVVFYNRFI
jgi:hypothetical protein